ncbi:MAG: hypothetical protein AAGD25_06715 [Cyanobacteria bacterium P01_F01_bin.150]
MTLTVGQQFTFSKQLFAPTGFTKEGFEADHSQGEYPEISTGDILASASTLKRRSPNANAFSLNARYTGTTPSQLWGHVVMGTPAIAFDNISKQRGDGAVTSATPNALITDPLTGATTAQIAITITINSVIDAAWNSVHHVYGGNQIVYLNTGSISQFSHVFRGGLGKNITYRGNDIFIAANPEVGDTETYVERWEISMDGGLACITQQEGRLIAIPEFTALSPNVLSTSYFQV